MFLCSWRAEDGAWGGGGGRLEGHDCRGNLGRGTEESAVRDEALCPLGEVGHYVMGCRLYRMKNNCEIRL